MKQNKYLENEERIMYEHLINDHIYHKANYLNEQWLRYSIQEDEIELIKKRFIKIDEDFMKGKSRLDKAALIGNFIYDVRLHKRYMREKKNG